MKKFLLIILCIVSSVVGDSGLSWYEKCQNYGVKKSIATQKSVLAKNTNDDLLVDHPQNPQLNFNSGVIALEAGDLDGAIDAFRRTVALEENDKGLLEKAYLNLGNSLAKKKELKSAAVAYEEVLKLNEANEQAKKNLEVIRAFLEEQKQNPPDQDQKDKDKKDKDRDGQDKQKEQQQKDNKQDKSEQSKDKKDGEKKDQGQDQQDKHDDSSQGEKEKDDAAGDAEPKQDSQKQERQDDGKQDGRNQQGQPADQDSQQKGGDKSQPDYDDNGKQQQPSVNHNDPQPKNESASQSQDTDQTKKKPADDLNQYMVDVLEQLEKEDKSGNKMFMQAQAQQQGKDGHGQKNW